MSGTAKAQTLCPEDPGELRPFPATARKVMSACENRDVNAKEIASILQHDPALSLRILQVANSPVYGFSGQIRSVDHATVVLGLKRVKNLATSLAVGQVFGDGCKHSARVRHQLWTHSLACGCFAGLLAERTQQCTAEEAFLAGILHDVGKLVLIDHNFEGYLKICGQPEPVSIASEAEFFGADHTVIGQRSGEHWGLPEDISEAIGFHHQPSACDFAVELVTTVATANQLAHLWLPGGRTSTANAAEVLEQVIPDLTDEDVTALQSEASTRLAAVIQAYAS